MPLAKLRKSYPRTVKLEERTFHLRRLEAKDREAVLAFARSLPEENLLFLRIDITQPAAVDKWIENEEAGRRVTVLAEHDGALVGYGSVNRDDLSWSRHLGEIRVIVAADQRGFGLGSLLTQEIFAAAQDLELTKIVARMAREQEEARRMFEGIGFQAEALLADWVIDRGGRTHDLIVMSHDVTSLTN